MAPKIRALVDANVLVAGTTYPRFPYEVLRHAVIGDYILVLSPQIIQEARVAVSVIFPNHKKQFDQILDAIPYEETLTPSEDDIKANSSLIRDLKDIHVALAAINAQVDLLITQDRDFTDRDNTTKELHEKINIILPGTFLREHMGWSSEELETIRKRTWDQIE